VPALANAEVVELWCGLRPDTPDHLPLLGPAGIEGLTIATGHYRNGILLAPITAKLVREWIVEKRVSMDWELFNPLRFTGGAGENPEDGDSVSSDPSSDQRGEPSPGRARGRPPGKGGSEFAHK
jgi:FAD dependent oxidoreductase